MPVPIPEPLVDRIAAQPFSAWGGVITACKLFGLELNGLLDELSEALAA